jgi:hypothetical protein
VYYICATFLPNPEHLHPHKSDSTSQANNDESHGPSASLQGSPFSLSQV